jgi:tetratricopeptide (TPR) repeat protein
LQAAALIRQANTLFYRKRHLQILQTYQEALQYVADVSPLLKGRIYSGLASIQATVGQKQEALRHMKLAHEVFPEHPEGDPGFLYTNTTSYILHFNDACIHLDFAQPKEAWEALLLAGSFVPNEVSPRGMELQNHRVIISIALNELEQSCAYFEKAFVSGRTLGSDLHQSEAQSLYDQMQAKWPHEKDVKELVDLFH